MAMTNKGGMHGFLTIVYGENVQAKREPPWNNLFTIASQVQDSPWLVSGDFNTARYTGEKVGGKALSLAQLSPFNDCLSHCNLSDLKSKSGIWSWNNKILMGGELQEDLTGSSARWVAGPSSNIIL